MQYITVDPLKAPNIFTNDNILCINLASLFNKGFSESSIHNILILNDYNYINLCNLASLCYRLGFNYNSLESISLIDKVIKTIRSINKNIIFTQNNIINCLECDMQPFKKLYYIDENLQIVYIHKILRDSLRAIGFVDTQIGNLLKDFRNIENIIPSDLLQNICFLNNESKITYDKIRVLLNT